ncbi:hypothetical protein BOX15_Mlig026653g2 [Macrostomum lignano]|uniref:RING-type E3 ubiquitin transferase n=1 Tax=Macrostomum lignano TaxID=282301 RepID=A0A267G5G2_9PLAT|nr:hypothetical protein BOX15_Mlig026653g2 [Macrostomum lignano]
MPSYFCHQCNTERASSEVSNDIDNSTITCSQCGMDFLEEINDSNRQDLLLPSAPASATAQHLRHLLHHLHHQEGPQQHQSVPLFSFGMHRMMNFLETGALDQVMTHLLGQVDSNGGAPPPATRQQLAAIKTVTIAEEQVKDGLQCFVCLDEFKQGVSADVLPCQHHFHQQCIKPWLEKRGTCPVCRSPLSASGTDGDHDEAAPGEDADAADSEAAQLGAVGGFLPPVGLATRLAAASAAAAAAAASASSSSSTAESRQGPSRGGRRRSRDYVEDDCD